VSASWNAIHNINSIAISSHKGLLFSPACLFWQTAAGANERRAAVSSYNCSCGGLLQVHQCILNFTPLTWLILGSALQRLTPIYRRATRRQLTLAVQYFQITWLL